MTRIINLLRTIVILATLSAVIYCGVYIIAIGVKRISEHEPPTYTPIEQSARDWGHEHLYGTITAVCDKQTCMVWAHYVRSTSPPILLNCNPVCIPDLQHSVIITKEHTQ